MFVNNCLTEKRSKLLLEARTLARPDLPKAAFSSDVKIFVIDKGGKRHLIKSETDIKTLEM